MYLLEHEENCKFKNHHGPVNTCPCKCTITVNTKDLMKMAIFEELKKKCPELEIGYWDCEKSFLGKCIIKDEGYDEVCIFCGRPEERK